jgi:4-amino-4-deoxy-L-arabinose transferase-like glycosyltransferase
LHGSDTSTLTPPNMSEKRIIFLIIFASYLVRFYNLITAAAIDMDGIGYAEAARYFASGAFGAALRCTRVPFYSLMIGSFHLLIPDVELAGRVVSLLSSVLLTLVVYLFSKRYFGERPALWAATLAAIHPLLIEYSTRMLSESLATLLFTGAICSFYKGWQGNQRWWLPASGILLALAYLTRPEYIIYAGPLALLLLLSSEKKLTNFSLFLLCFLVLGCSFLIYVRVSTGFWVIDKKMLNWGPAVQGSMGGFSRFFGHVSPAEAVGNFPLVVWNFCRAIFPPFLLLVIAGLWRTERHYRLLFIILVAIHILGRSFVGHSSRRYSVEFIPLAMILAVGGAESVKQFLSRFRHERLIFISLACTLVGLSLVVGLSPRGHGRQMHKEIGLFLQGMTDKGAIASRLPVASFYADKQWVDLQAVIDASPTCEALYSAMKERKVRYLVLDDGMEKERLPRLACLGGGMLLKEASDGKGYVKAYRIDGLAGGR